MHSDQQTTSFASGKELVNLTTYWNRGQQRTTTNWIDALPPCWYYLPCMHFHCRHSFLLTSHIHAVVLADEYLNSSRLQHFRDARRNLTEGLLHTNEDLLDLATDLQAQVSRLELENDYLRQNIRSPAVSNPSSTFHYAATPTSTSKGFAVILLDADCYVFRHEYLVDGTIGGQRAADELYLRASDYLRQELDVAPTEPLEIIVKAYAYHHGLSNALQRNGLIKSGKDFDLFVEAFNQRVPLFDFADVGSGKERADNKIREW